MWAVLIQLKIFANKTINLVYTFHTEYTFINLRKNLTVLKRFRNSENTINEQITSLSFVLENWIYPSILWKWIYPFWLLGTLAVVLLLLSSSSYFYFDNFIATYHAPDLWLSINSKG